MEKSSFAMAKFGLEHKEAMPKRDCGFYVKYIFLFTSLIQFLIILGLVLFMVYGNAQAGTDTHLRLLEEQVQSHYRRIVALGATNANLSRALNATLKDRDKVQGVALKAQRELEKCNSSQASSSIPQLRELLFRQVRLTECQVITALINNTCTAEKLRLQQQLDQASSSKKTLEEKTRQGQAELSRAKQEGERCQQELESARTESRLRGMELEVHKQRCSSLQSDVSEKILHVSELARKYQCKEAEQELGRMRGSVEQLLLRQKERDEDYVWRSSCELSVRQCRHNCSRDAQELQQRMQELRKGQRDGEEERKRMQAEREKVGKELEEQRKAAAAMEESLRQQLGVCMGTKALQKGQRDGEEERKRMQAEREKVGKELEEQRKAAAAMEESLRQQLGVCMGTKMSHLDLPGSRGPGSAARSGPFPGTAAYLELLRNPATLGTMGMQSPVDLQQMLQLMEQYTATLKNVSG